MNNEQYRYYFKLYMEDFEQSDLFKRLKKEAQA